MDLFDFDEKDYLITVDYYSKYFETAQLSSTSTAAVIKHTRPMFARLGIPEEVVSDNGPSFSSSEFKSFSKAYGFKHTTSSPSYPQSNGLVERAVQTVKQILLKAKHDKTDPNLALLDLRNTPLEGLNKSPVQLLFGRRTRTQLPTNPKLLEPIYDGSKIKAQLHARQVKQKSYYDRAAKPLVPLHVGENVRIKDTSTSKQNWKPAIVTGTSEHPRSYIVESDGKEYRRNRRHLLKCPAVQEQSSISEPETDVVEDTQGHPSDTPTEQIPPTATRSRRIVKTPARFADYTRC